MSQLLEYLLHIDVYLTALVAYLGPWAYVLLFAIIFSETGLIIVPFLPGDSLLFALGSLSAQSGSPLNVALLFLLLSIAAIAGNELNYSIGRYLGLKAFSKGRSFLFNKKYLEHSHAFYKKHGAMTIIIARFVPIVRSFAPFVAGIGYMNRPQFVVYNALGALLWIGLLLGAGYFLGALPLVQKNFSWVIYSILMLSILLPIAQGLVGQYKKKRKPQA